MKTNLDNIQPIKWGETKGNVWSEETLGKSFIEFNVEMEKYNIVRIIIKDKQLRIPYDLTLESTIINSLIEPNFVDEVKKKYPEYFV